MNYRYQFSSWGDLGVPTGRRWGYSNGQCPVVGHFSDNTCNASHCVPNTETSPKSGCSPNNGSCDCDRAEWDIVNLDIPGYALMSYEECQAAQCSGASGGLPRPTSSATRSSSAPRTGVMLQSADRSWKRRDYERGVTSSSIRRPAASIPSNKRRATVLKMPTGTPVSALIALSLVVGGCSRMHGNPAGVVGKGGGAGPTRFR